jgi:hypothetical protein
MLAEYGTQHGFKAAPLISSQSIRIAIWSYPMLNRLFVLMFLAIILGGPFAAIIAITDGTKAFGQEAQQKGMCLTTGTGCGNGNIIVTVAGRI